MRNNHELNAMTLADYLLNDFIYLLVEDEIEIISGQLVADKIEIFYLNDRVATLEEKLRSIGNINIYRDNN